MPVAIMASEYFLICSPYNSFTYTYCLFNKKYLNYEENITFTRSFFAYR